MLNMDPMRVFSLLCAGAAIGFLLCMVRLSCPAHFLGGEEVELIVLDWFMNEASRRITSGTHMVDPGTIIERFAICGVMPGGMPMVQCWIESRHMDCPAMLYLFQWEHEQIGLVIFELFEGVVFDQYAILENQVLVIRIRENGKNTDFRFVLDPKKISKRRW